MATSERLLTADELLLLPDVDRFRELVRGRIVDRPLHTPWHGFVCGNVGRKVNEFVRRRDAGWVMQCSGIITERNPDTVRCADVSYYSYERLPKGSVLLGYLDPAPDAIFEVVAVEEHDGIIWKAEEYLTAGCQAVALLLLVAQAGLVLEPRKPWRPIGKNDMLTLPTVLPGFEMPLPSVFGDG